MNIRFLLILCSLLLSRTVSSDPVSKLAKKVPNPRERNGTWIFQEKDVLGSRAAELNATIDSFERATGNEACIAIPPSVTMIRISSPMCCSIHGK